MREMAVVLRLFRSFPVVKNSFTVLTKSPPMNSQCLLKKAEVYPSDPDDLSILMLKRDFLYVVLSISEEKEKKK